MLDKGDNRSYKTEEPCSEGLESCLADLLAMLRNEEVRC